MNANTQAKIRSGVGRPLEPVPVKQLDHLNMTVKDLAATLEFYSSLFGFEVVEEHDGSDPHPWVIIRSGSAMLCLYQHSNLRTSERFPRGPEVQEVRHFALRISDGPAFERLCRQKGFTLEFGGPVRWPHSTSYYILDPTGHQIEVVAWDDDEIRFSS
jgi:catechol 2,3-dioxygenase-like lactoylglutathione lyase family enzyme